MKKIFILFLAFITLFSMSSCHGTLIKDSGRTEKEETVLSVPPEEFDTSRNNLLGEK